MLRVYYESKEEVVLGKEERGIARGGRGAKEVRREVTAFQLLGTVTCVSLGACSVRLRRVFSRVVCSLAFIYARMSLPYRGAAFTSLNEHQEGA